MVKNTFQYPINYVKEMTVEQQHRYLYLLIEQERRGLRHGGLKKYQPKWWPKTIKYHHPMFKDKSVMVDEWKRSLFKLFKSYFKVNVDYLFYSKLAKYVIKNDGFNADFLKVIKHKESEPKVNKAVFSPVPKEDNRICIKEKTIKLIIGDPKVVLYDVVKYGVIGRVNREISEQESFLLNLQLIKTGETSRSNRNGRSFRYSKAKANIRIQTLGRNTEFDYVPDDVHVRRSTDSRSIDTDTESTKLRKGLHELLKTLTKENSFRSNVNPLTSSNFKSIENDTNLIKHRFPNEFQTLSKTTNINKHCKIDYFVSDCDQPQNKRTTNLKVQTIESQQISKTFSNVKTQNSTNSSNHQCTPCFVRLVNSY